MAKSSKKSLNLGVFAYKNGVFSQILLFFCMSFYLQKMRDVLFRLRATRRNRLSKHSFPPLSIRRVFLTCVSSSSHVCGYTHTHRLMEFWGSLLFLVTGRVSPPLSSWAVALACVSFLRTLSWGVWRGYPPLLFRSA